MMIAPDDKFVEAVMAYADESSSFAPFATYIPEGDCVESVSYTHLTLPTN